MKWNKINIVTDDGKSSEAEAPVIISASRRTDIPAFYADRFVERVKKGYIKLFNPFNRAPLYVSFVNVRLIVFWSKNPKPLMKYLNLFDENNIYYYFQYTLNDYDKEKLEPNVPNTGARIETFIELSERIGKDKVIWRFDPLLLTDCLNVETLLYKIENIGEQLKNHASKMVFSFADIQRYKKVQNNLKRCSIRYMEFNERLMYEFVEGLSQLNQKWKLEIGSCAEENSFEKYSIVHNKCIDDDLIIKLFSHDKPLMEFLGVKFIKNDLFNGEKQIIKTRDNEDKGQREFCKCIISKDIGEYNTCPHRCVYCYANAE
ncbi:MAG: DUF1848 domain-containing protein [Bacteroidia bacterium]|nr:DUF1848 domain-containing protein [Bacteroidia bacterium]